MFCKARLCQWKLIDKIISYVKIIRLKVCNFTTYLHCGSIKGHKISIKQSWRTHKNQDYVLPKNRFTKLLWNIEFWIKSVKDSTVLYTISRYTSSNDFDYHNVWFLGLVNFLESITQRYRQRNGRAQKPQTPHACLLQPTKSSGWFNFVARWL